jgi:plasmid stabilization system protein ParE
LQQLQEKAQAKLTSLIDATGDQMSAEDKAQATQDIMDAIAGLSAQPIEGLNRDPVVIPPPSPIC